MFKIKNFFFFRSALLDLVAPGSENINERKKIELFQDRIQKYFQSRI